MAKIIDINKFWLIKDNPVSCTGVYQYLGKSINKNCDPNKLYSVYRPEGELNNKETLDSLQLLPIINEHQMIGADYTPPEHKGIDGVIGENVYFDKGKIYADLKIFSEEMKQDIQNGKKELSLGYTCVYEHKEGEYNGQKYDYIQRNIRGNHLALVNKGRMGRDVRVLDSVEDNEDIKFAMDNIELLVVQKTKGEKTMANKQQKAVAQDEDKRKLIDEIGGILKDKVSEEDWRTIIGKIEDVAYNPSSDTNKTTDTKDTKSGNDKNDKTVKADDNPKDTKDIKTSDKCTKDTKDIKSNAADGADTKDDIKKEETDTVKQTVLDEGVIIKMIARKNKLAEEVEKIIGTFDHSEMTEQQVAEYAAEKLGLPCKKGEEITGVNCFLKNQPKTKVIVSFGQDTQDTKEDEEFLNFQKGE